MASITGCPRCHAELRRVPRTGLDRAISRFVPLIRMQCVVPECGWNARVYKIDDGHSRAFFSALIIVVTFVVGLALALVAATQ